MRPVVAVLVAGLVLGLSPVAALAQQSPPAPETLRLAQTLVEISGSSEAQTLAALGGPLTTLMTQMLSQIGVTDPAKAQTLVQEAVMPMLDEHYPDLLGMSARSYAEVLSDDDIKAAIAFYSTPAGKDLARLGPQLSQAKLEAMTQWIASVQPELLAKVMATIKAHHWDKPAPTSGAG